MASPDMGRDMLSSEEGRLVVHFRLAEAPDFDASPPTSRAGADAGKLSLLESVAGLGGLVSGWSHDFITADFPATSVEDVIGLLTSSELPPEFSVGVCTGPLQRIRTVGPLCLAEGESLRRARRLSEAARPGEVLVSDDLAKTAGLRGVSEPSRRPVRDELHAISLDLEAPVRATPDTSVDQSGVPPAPVPEVISETPGSVSGETIRRFRAEKVASKKEGGLGTCRASLALAVALSQLGREGEAILEALEGLSWARETNDARGERACALFLVQCADRRGEDGIARTWSEVASRKLSATEV